MRYESEKALNTAARPADVPKDFGTNTEALLFESDEWFALLAEHCFGGQAPIVIRGDAGSTSCSLVMCAGGPATLTSLSNWYSFRWSPLYADTGTADSRFTALCDAVGRLRNHTAHAVFSPVGMCSGQAEQLIAALRKSGWHVSSKVQSQNCWADIGDQDFEAWWADRPGQLRSTVTRKGKKGVVDIAIEDRFCAADWQSYVDVYADSWKEAEGHPAFLRALAQAASARGALRLGLARIDGRVVAAQFWTVEAGVASIHKLAQLRDDSINAHSPGTLLTYALYRHCAVQDRVRRIDFGTGHDGFKNGWTDASTELLTIEAIDLRQAKGWLYLGRHALSRVAARLSRR